MARSSKGISLSQRKYALEILEYARFLGAKPARFPMEQNLVLTQSDGKHDPSSYRLLVGRLIYLTITRHDLVYYVHVLSQFMDKPHVPHLEATHSVLRYLNQMLGQGIILSSTSTLQLNAFCDADWAGSLQGHKKISDRILCFSWTITYLLENKEADNGGSINCWGRISF